MLSIAMMVKNEEKNLEATLKALEPVRNKIDTELVIVDTGSTDRTINIARRYTDKVFIHKWEDDFAKMRNISLSYCTGEWILVIDADEVLENPQEIIELFSTNEISKYKSVTVKIRNFSDRNQKNYNIANIHRLFKNDKNLRYVGIIHEAPIFQKPTLISNIIFNHKGYMVDDYSLMEYKFKRNTELLLKNIEKKGDDIYSYFQLAQSYSLANKDIEAMLYINKAIDLINEKNLFSRYLFIFATYYRLLYQIKEYDKCIEVCKKVMNEDKNVLDTYFLIGACYYFKGEYKLAIKYAKEYIKVKKLRENKNIIKDINLEEFSLDKEEEIIEIIISSYIMLKKYTEAYYLIKDNEELIKKDKILRYYCLSIVMLDKIDDLRKLFNEINSKELHNFVIEAINSKVLTIDIKRKSLVLSKYLNINPTIDLYLYIVKLNIDKNFDYSNIAFEVYKHWKAEVLIELIKKDKLYLNILYNLSYSSIREYLNNIIEDYKCIEILLEYSKERIFTDNLKELMILDHIEELLIRSNKIVGKEFKFLVNRRIINKYKLINTIYNEEILKLDIYKSLLSKEEIFWYKLRKIVGKMEENLLEVIKELQLLIKENNLYKEVYELILKDLNSVNNVEAIIHEKAKVLMVVNELVNSGEIAKAENIVNELEKIIGISSEIYNVRGVIAYINGDINSALEELLNGFIINYKNKDIIFNINQILNEIGRNSYIS